ncbi:immune inhibitor A domain-containing protein [Promicromonospora panici]|uniref:immune inhibitor A domain-containing protein n=1 Tax=Promicromonospora panici TaxID=2219658 RepID=UPI00101C6266|nr:immune inhibitor A domain-containing protein [Promicromonospora panici]
MRTPTRRALRSTVAAIPVVALTVAGLAATGGATTVSATGNGASAIKSSEHYINYADVAAQPEVGDDVEITADGRSIVHKAEGETGVRVDASVQAASDELAKKFSSGNPAAAEQLAKLEREAVRTGKSPQAIKQARYKSAPRTQEARLLTILVEFDENANDDFTDQMVPTFWGSSECMPGNVQNGPLHNNIPNPAEASQPDNNTMWVEDFSPEHFDKMLFTEEGITERVRPDLTGPDGRPGIDISGYTMKNMYEEMSRGAYTVSGSATPWVKVPHSEAWYGAQRCFLNDEGEWEAGAFQTMNGHPDNPAGPGQLPIDAVAKLAEMQPDFPWADYDIEDQADRDGDGNVNEPDGVIDHVVLVHAGEDKSGGGGAQGTYAIWAHSSTVPGGAPIPGTDLRLSNYIVQPEDSGVGVFAHEYGHDLGLPDLYDTASGGDSDVDFWDLMSSGSHSGPIFQSMPTHMGIWDKWVLGWVDPVEVDPGDDELAIKVGQASRPLKGTQDGVKINLPDKHIELGEPHSGEAMWYTGSDQSWADVRLSRTLDVPAAATFSFWADYSIEADWDFGFVEISTDGGATWEEQKVFDDAGAEVTTPDGYADPNGRMADYGGKKYGLTGTTEGWAHLNVDLSAFAGQTVQLRLRYATDEAFEDRGWFSDDFELTSGSEVVWSDDVESGEAGWTPEVSTFTETTGNGWHIFSGSSVQEHFYLVEWRNLDGFDEGLRYAYDSTYAAPQTDAWKVEKIAYNAPGMLVWYRDTTYGDQNHVLNNLSDLPSTGAKGGLLLVDSHFDPLRRDDSATPDTSALKNLPSRPQSSNVAFGLRPTYPFTECITGEDTTVEFCTDFEAQAPVRTFTDDTGWYPGIELNNGGLFYRDSDASTVVPSVDNSPYTVRMVDEQGEYVPELFGEDFGIGAITGTGNPADDGVGYGTVIHLKKAFKGNQSALIQITPPLSGQ